MWLFDGVRKNDYVITFPWSHDLIFFIGWKNLKKSEKNLKNTEKIPYIAETAENVKNTKNKNKKNQKIRIKF